MKTIKRYISLLGVLTAGLLLAGCGEPVVGPQGPQGEKGADGTSFLSGQANPSTQEGKTGDSYLNLTTWDLFLKNENGWSKTGNIKGEAGEKGETGEKGDSGEPGISIVDTIIDEKGDLIITLSNGETVNAGHVKDVDQYTVKFYCDDLLVDTQLVKHGDRIKLPELYDFSVKHWYLDKEFEYEWIWYGYGVTESMTLYGDYTALPDTLHFDETTAISVDEYGFGSALNHRKEICASKGVEPNGSFAVLEERGILFNKEHIGPMSTLKLGIAEGGFSSAKIYFGNNPLSFENYYDLHTGINDLDLTGAEYFTIQNAGSEPISIRSLTIDYMGKADWNDDSLPRVEINTDDPEAIITKESYVGCTVSTVGGESDVSDLKAEIKIRGNSTAICPKKPYRIKLDKKNSLFGYEKAKNWVLLADYMDGSKMHNYTALKFAKMVRGEGSFGVNPLHVNVILNGENVGIYEFGEHIETKEGRLNIEQKKIWKKSFDEINFYIERDAATLADPSEIEGETYFRVPLENYVLDEYVFALKYPEKEDFEEELASGEIDPHEEEFQAFFNALKEHMTDVCNRFVDYRQDKAAFESVCERVDVESLALYAVTDQAFHETDHFKRSFKMYRADGGLLKFGPNWDYDACSYGLYYIGETYVLDPFALGAEVFMSIDIYETWSLSLFQDAENGLPLFKNIWDEITSEQIAIFLAAQRQEMEAIAAAAVADCGQWMDNQYYALFDNQQYYWKWTEAQLPFLKGYYADL